MNRGLRIALGMALCCTTLVGAALANNIENAITAVEFGTTPLGHATRKQVEARYGKPLKASQSTARPQASTSQRAWTACTTPTRISWP